MSNITFEQEELAVLTELDDQKTVALVGGKVWELPKWELPKWQPLKWQPPKWQSPTPPSHPPEKACDPGFSISVEIVNQVNVSVDIPTKH